MLRRRRRLLAIDATPGAVAITVPSTSSSSSSSTTTTATSAVASSLTLPVALEAVCRYLERADAGSFVNDSNLAVDNNDDDDDDDDDGVSGSTPMSIDAASNNAQLQAGESVVNVYDYLVCFFFCDNHMALVL